MEETKTEGEWEQAAKLLEELASEVLSLRMEVQLAHAAVESVADMASDLRRLQERTARENEELRARVERLEASRLPGSG